MCKPFEIQHSGPEVPAGPSTGWGRTTGPLGVLGRQATSYKWLWKAVVTQGTPRQAKEHASKPLQSQGYTIFFISQHEESHRDDNLSPTLNIDKRPFSRRIPSRKAVNRLLPPPAPRAPSRSTDWTEEFGIIRATTKGGSSLKICSIQMQVMANWALSLRRYLFSLSKH